MHKEWIFTVGNRSQADQGYNQALPLRDLCTGHINILYKICLTCPKRPEKSAGTEN